MSLGALGQRTEPAMDLLNEALQSPHERMALVAAISLGRLVPDALPERALDLLARGAADDSWVDVLFRGLPWDALGDDDPADVFQTVDEAESRLAVLTDALLQAPDWAVAVRPLTELLRLAFACRRDGTFVLPVEPTADDRLVLRTLAECELLWNRSDHEREMYMRGLPTDRRTLRLLGTDPPSQTPSANRTPPERPGSH
jgi:hypothetical protein